MVQGPGAASSTPSKPRATLYRPPTVPGTDAAGGALDVAVPVPRDPSAPNPNPNPYGGVSQGGAGPALSGGSGLGLGGGGAVIDPGALPRAYRFQVPGAGEALYCWPGPEAPYVRHYATMEALAFAEAPSK